MSEYSVATTNRFALSVDEDEDLYELLEKQQKEKKVKEEQAVEAAKAAKVTASKGKTDKRNSAKVPNKRVVNKTSDEKSQPQQTNKPYSRNDENRPPRFARQNREGGDNQNFEKPPTAEGFGGRGRRGGSARGRGGPRGGFGGRPAKREFERHSGSDKTGVKAVEKREGGGPHNWGDKIEAQLEQPETQTEPAPEQENTENTENQEPEVKDEGPKIMTLDEWKASLTKTNPDFKVRKANEGADSKQWKGTVALQKKKKGESVSDEDEDDDEYIEEGQDVDETRANLEKLNIRITFADGSRAVPKTRGRGARGGYAGGNQGQRPGRGGRGGFSDRRGDGSRGYVPRVDNESDFPSLGSR